MRDAVEELDWHRFRERVAEIAGVPGSELRRETRLVGDLGMDSVALVELAALLEELGAGGATEELERTGWEAAELGAIHDECLSAGRVERGG